MKGLIAIYLLLLGFSGTVFAQKAGVTFGLSQIQIEGASGVDVSSNGSYQLGALFYQPMNELLEVRMGALFGQENLTATSAGSSDTTINLTYINVPLTLGYRFAERFLMFIGPVIKVNAGKSCKATGGCSISSLKVKGTDMLLSLGGHMQLTEVLGLELSLDRMSGKPFEGTSGGQIINVNFQYLIE